MENICRQKNPRTFEYLTNSNLSLHLAAQSEIPALFYKKPFHAGKNNLFNIFNFYFNSKL